ncbi:MAG: UbiD family decarboxylase [Clostridia bacterium]|jgi:2,5-furandicarboxylate decarboxylase 1|nr:UbiD family decarboxylase [Clostridia bacterium]
MVTLRDYLNLLEDHNELLIIREEVDPCYELSAILREASGFAGGPAVLFNSVKGFPGRRVVGNLLASRKKMALALNTNEAKLKEAYLTGREKSLPPEVVINGPVQENIVSGEIDLLSILPAPLFHEGDAGHYLTSAVIMAKDPETGEQNAGIHRVQLKGGNRLGIFLANPPIAEYLAKAEKRGEPLPIAITLGWHPAAMIAAAAPVPRGQFTKLHLAGGLLGGPVQLVQAKTVDLMVPADGDIILEGHVLPGIREKEGPFGESSGYYFEHNSPVVEVTAVTHRNDFILQVIQPWGIETEVILAVCSGSELWQELKKKVPGVIDVGYLPGALAFQGVISVAGDMKREEIKRLIHLSLSISSSLKHVIIVDEDIDVHNPREVLWALATRFQAHRDLTVVDGIEGYPIDPSARNNPCAKMGMDATARPGGPMSADFRRLVTPEASKEKAQKILR